MRRLIGLGLAASWLLAGAVARADDPPAAPPPPPATPPAREPVPEVRVIGDKADALQKVPGSGTLVTTKEIERDQPADVSEILRRVPGLTATAETGGGLRLDVGIHGLDPGRSRRILILEDGVPITVNPYAEPDVYYVPAAERMRGVEVVKGSGNILFGPQTIGGVINFLTLVPPEHRHETAELDAGFWAGDRCGSSGLCLLGNRPMGYASVLASHGDAPSEHVRYVVQVLHKDSDGIQAESFHQTDALGKLVFDTSARGEATLKLGFHDDEVQSDDNGLTQGMYAQDARQPTRAPADRTGQQRYDVALTQVQRFGENTKLTTIAYAYRTQRIWNRQDYDRNTPDASLLPLDQYDHIVGDQSLTGGAIYFRGTDTILDRHYEVAGVEPRLEWRTATGEIEHTLNVGARMLYEAAHYEQRSGDTPTSNAGTLDYVFDHNSLAFATYAEDRLEMRKWLLVTPGVRFEEAYFRSNVTRQGDLDTAQPASGQSGGVIPGIGMVAGTPKANVYGGMHVGWAPPRITSPISPKAGTSVAQLDAESSINYEVGTRLVYKRLARFEGTAYLIDFNNQVVSNSGALATSGVTQLANGGATRHYGVEGAASFGLGEALGLRPVAVDLGARYTFARAFFDGGAYSGNWLPYAPGTLLVGTLDVEHPSGFGAEVAWTYVGAQFTDAQNTVALDATGRVGKIPAYQTVDVMARYKLAKTGLTFKLAVKDAMNETFIYALRPDGIRVGGFRQILLGARWDWDEKRSRRSERGPTSALLLRRRSRGGRRPAGPRSGELELHRAFRGLGLEGLHARRRLRLHLDLRAVRDVLRRERRVLEHHRAAPDAPAAAALAGVRHGSRARLRVLRDLEQVCHALADRLRRRLVLGRQDDAHAVLRVLQRRRHALDGARAVRHLAGARGAPRELQVLLAIARLAAQPVDLLGILCDDGHLRSLRHVGGGDRRVLEDDWAAAQEPSALAVARVLHVRVRVLLGVDERLHASADVRRGGRLGGRHRHLHASGDVLDVRRGARDGVRAVGHLAARRERGRRGGGRRGGARRGRRRRGGARAGGGARARLLVAAVAACEERDESQRNDEQQDGGLHENLPRTDGADARLVSGGNHGTCGRGCNRPTGCTQGRA